jgi:hypothetical protein
MNKPFCIHILVLVTNYSVSAEFGTRPLVSASVMLNFRGTVLQAPIKESQNYGI